MLTAVLDVRRLAWGVAMVYALFLTCLGDVLGYVELATTLEDISQFLILDLAILVLVNEIVDKH